MWFNNLQLYTLTQDLNWDPEVLASKLEEHRFTPCGREQAASFGWIAPLHADGPLVHTVDGKHLIALRREEKIIPAPVLTRKLNEELVAMRARSGRNPTRAEKLEAKDRVRLALLPQAFTKTSDTHLYIDAAHKRVVVNAGGANAADAITSALRDVIDSFPIAPAITKESPRAAMTRWLQSRAFPGDFEVTNECELREPIKSGAVVRCKREDMFGTEIETHLGNGKMVYALGLRWQNCLNFILDDEGAVKRLKADTRIIEEIANTAVDGDIAKRDAEFAVMVAELDNFIPALYQALGGLMAS